MPSYQWPQMPPHDDWAGSCYDPRSARGRLTILVVEDEELIRLFVADALQDSGHTVLEAGTVAEAKRLLIENSVDLVFSDINMPGSETGFALEKWVRRQYKRTKVLLTSGFPQNPCDTSSLLEPMLQKPYTTSVLLQRINSIFDADPMA